VVRYPNLIGGKPVFPELSLVWVPRREGVEMGWGRKTGVLVEHIGDRRKAEVGFKPGAKRGRLEGNPKGKFKGVGRARDGEKE